MIRISKHSDGTIAYLNEAGLYHREDGPAIQFFNKTNHYYKNGDLHREDGPAIERHNGDKYWFLNDVRHRKDGAAIELVNGYKEYWLYGKKYDVKSDEEWQKLVMKILLLG
jgi:hypothetical protein